VKVRALILMNVIAVTGALPLGAQQATLEEVTVTATRRAENLQDVANSATVFSGADLASLGVLEPRDLAEHTPGLLTKFGPNGLATVGFYMRGVGINDFTGTVDPSVGIYVDEVFKPTPDMLNFAVFDIERVEVLRGPQGTLYGRNSTGGAVNFILAKPTPEFEGFVRAGYGSYETASLTGALSGPLSPTLRGRLSVAGQYAPNDSGYAFNRTTNNDLGQNESLAARGQLHWLPSEDFNLRFTYSYGDKTAEQPLLVHVGARDATDPSRVCTPVVQGRRSEGECVDFLGYFDPDNDPYAGDANIDPLLEIESNEFTATGEWNLGRATLTTISGYDDFAKRQSQDIDASPNVAADNFTFSDVENFSQEVRLTSDESFKMEWIVGANYGNTKVDWFQTIDLSALAIPTSNGAEQETEAWAVFGQLSFPLAEKFELVGGLRYTNETRDWVGATFVGTFTDLAAAFASGAPTLSRLPLPAGDPNQGGPLDFDNNLDESNVDYQAVLKYTPSDNSMFYVSTSEAFRSGGFSSAVIFSQEALEPYDPENLTAYETGFKLTFPGVNARLNASAFFYDFEGFQATFVRATEASARLQNAGDVETTGLEASLDWYPNDRLGINLGVSLLDSEIVSTDVVLPPLDAGAEQTIEGNEVPNAPSYSINGRVSYEAPLFAGFDTGLQLDFTSVDSHFLEPNNRAVLSEDGYFLLNTRISLAPSAGSWEVAAWVRNLTDEEYLSAAQDLALALGFNEIVMGQPRTWGVDFEYQF
jgi:iron complex outermembrane recepter protein